MPRRNLLVLIVVALLALLCYQHVQHNPYGRVLAEAMSTIEKRSLDPVEPAKLFEGAMKGMMGRLDKNSAFIPAKDLRKFEKEVDSKFPGVGIELAQDPKTGQLIVLSPIPGSPAHRAGVRAGDRILRIGETATDGMSLEKAVELLGGKPGESVTLSVLHQGAKEPVDVTIVRALIEVDTVRGDARNADGAWNFLLPGHDRIGYVRITGFSDNTPEELEKALDELKEQEMRGLVLDLRDNPGGYIDAAVAVCDMFIPSGVIVTTRRRDGKVGRTFTATGKGRFTDIPMAVIVNQYSASAAEIVAACLQDHKRATVVGQRSYGKGTVQDFIYLEDGCGAMKLTTSSYWRPSGENIQRSHASDNGDWGVSPDPDGKLPIADEEQARWRQWRMLREAFNPSANNGDALQGPPVVDGPLDRAVECVEKEAAKR